MTFALIVFMAAMIGAIVFGYSMVIALIIGLIGFLIVGHSRGYSYEELRIMGMKGIKDSLIVIVIMCIIGMLTATWRMCGTITVFVYYGISLIVPPMFILIAFLLSSLLGYAIGTSFGISATVGVIFMSLARFGGVDPAICAGALMSGVYFGDRGSPASSAATLVSAITHTDMMSNVKMLMKTAMLPFGLCLAIYGILSIRNPLNTVDPDLIAALENTFIINGWAFIPAVIMLILPLLKVSIRMSMSLSILAGVAVSYFVQGISIPEILRFLACGYSSGTEGIGSILDGGGLCSMLEIAMILTVSSAYSGIFEGTGMLDNVQSHINDACGKWGSFPVMCLSSAACAMVFCNQTITSLICGNLFEKAYGKDETQRSEKAVDLCNSTLVIAGLVPWSIACSVPLNFLGVEYPVMIYACYLYLIPLCYIFTKKHWFKSRNTAAKE